MKKNLLAITVCFVACLLLAGCTESHAETGSSAQQADTQDSVESPAASETTSASKEAASDAEPAADTTPTASSSTPAVYFTSDISAEGLVKIYDSLGWTPEGRAAVKISTGEPPASNYLRPELIGDLVKKVDGTIVECNTAYGGSRSSSAMHKQVAEDHGFTAIADFDLMVNVFGGNEAWGVLMAATVGVPLYACGGGTIPLLQQWLWDGMSLGSAAAFMITGPATKITNLGALKIAMGWKRFALYIGFVMLFSFLCGMIVNLAV